MRTDTTFALSAGSASKTMIGAERGPDHLLNAEIIEVMGLRLHNIDRHTIAKRVVAAADKKQKMLVVNANAHLVVLSQKLPWMRLLFSQADIAFCDGAGVQLAARFLTGRALHRTTPPEWIGEALRSLGSNASIFWLGGRPEVVEEAARRYDALYGTRTVGIQHGFFDMSPNSTDTRMLVDRINRAAPSILLVNMGMPRQEQWLWENWPRLEPGVAITGGALVDHAAGLVQRPPRWVANLGIEWLVRLAREPRRLWRRYLLGLPVFGFYVFRHAISAQDH
jgi:N-acetylglucosaminyldiphosphoundecaprenol N-acetyl-beta-D-mannosaminyltransferase